ncbi:Na+/H+ antiporter NhaC family protein [Cerasicoccus maritimus]|uniref:Na+/H+ antiporter NhaC family protein n=1 Tax=Cerasicoccus maritimus TaxID=490089 RepID=UPI0028527ACB|nr:Na+/H+ antiporter NhaC family protein [Cerasicoccus maritimus]
MADAAQTEGVSRVRWGAAVILWAISWPLGWQMGGATGSLLTALWPSIVALGVVYLTRNALLGLVAGAAGGAIILCDGRPWVAFLSLMGDHFAPHFTSEWKLSAVAFTLLLGGFAAVLERSGGLEYFLRRYLLRGGESPTRLQAGAAGLGLVCFFDGLANSVLVGRLVSPLAERHGVSRVKLAYLADSTSSAVACVAFLSTWIAYQLSMIREGFALIGEETNPYAWFLRSLPYNYYCWFTLLMVALVIWRNFNPGPMGAYERAARAKAGQGEAQGAESTATSGGLLLCVVSLLTLLLALLGGLYYFGVPSALGDDAAYFPLTVDKVTASFGSNAGAFVLVFGGVVASLAALLFFPLSGRTYAEGGKAYGAGVKHLMAPVLILVGAWMLSSTLSSLNTGKLLGDLVGAWAPLALLPVIIFVFGALISFSTGTSWGTMGILMPLAIPLIANHPGAELGDLAPLYAAAVGAVFSGAVFGDHCSPISDTTLVSAITCDVTPHDHVRTQLPFALMSALAAAVLGFIPAGLGAPGWVGLLVGAGALIAATFALKRWSAVSARGEIL